VDVQDLKRNVLKVSRNSSVGIATRYGLDGSLFEPRCGGWGGGGARFYALVNTYLGDHPASCPMRSFLFWEGGIRRPEHDD